jgi:hypothetical protein
MQSTVESTTRGPIDFFHFGLIFFAIILGAAGIVTTSIAASVSALVLVLFGLAYFIVNS